jgi:ABC-2 type transport system ATP-binding protein
LAAIRTEGLTKRYGDVTALNGLDLSIEKGSVFGFLGPNGAGKTTTVKLLTGLSQPTSGRAWVAGEEVVHQTVAFKKKIGYLPDVPGFYSWMTAREYLMFTGELFGLSPQENKKRCEELLELVELKKAARRKVGGYSRGMRQRLGIAQALLGRPQVLFMDEPTSALDPVGRREVLELIKRLKEEATIFMSTHILSDVERVCDTLGIIDQGKLVTVSTVEELRRRYAPSVIELQFEEDSAPLLPLLEGQPWLEKVEAVNSNGLPAVRIKAIDVSKAKAELPRLIADSGLSLSRYEVKMPSLEDIFVELVSGGGGL